MEKHRVRASDLLPAGRSPAPSEGTGGEDTDDGLRAKDLSLSAELLLLAIDPTEGGLFPHNRRRFRKALVHANRADRADATTALWAAGRVRRKALRELERAGLVERRWAFGRLRLADQAARRRFHQLVHCLREDELTDPRDRVLLLLLAGSGVLANRLSYRGERLLAARRLRTLVRSHQRASLIPPAHGAHASITAGVSALGNVDLGITRDLLGELFEGLVSGDMGDFGVSDLTSGGFDHGGGSGGGSESGASGGGYVGPW